MRSQCRKKEKVWEANTCHVEICGNIQSINAKFDEFQSFVIRVNTSHPISATCLQECWLDDKDTESFGFFNLSDYTMVQQTKQCCGHGGGSITYIHN